MAESSDRALWHSFLQKGKELRKVAQHIVQTAAELNVPTGYTGVESMITIDKDMPIDLRVLEQANRLEALTELAHNSDTRLATRVVGGAEGGHTGVTQGARVVGGAEGGHSGVTQGASITEGASSSKQSKRPPPAVIDLARNTKPRIGPRTLCRNKVGEVNVNVHDLISAARPQIKPTLCVGPLPSYMLRARLPYKLDFHHRCIEFQHAAYWNESKILLGAELTNKYTQYISEHPGEFEQFGGKLNSHENSIQNGMPPITHIWSRAGCVIPRSAECLEGIVKTFWLHGVDALRESRSPSGAAAGSFRGRPRWLNAPSGGLR